MNRVRVCKPGACSSKRDGFIVQQVAGRVSTTKSDALKGFNARRAWRGWSAVDASVHHAFYEFDDLAQAQAIQGTDAFKHLVAEFDRVWGDKVTRNRDFVEVIQTVGT